MGWLRCKQPPSLVAPRLVRGAQYAATSRPYRYRLWNTGRPVKAGR